MARIELPSALRVHAGNQRQITVAAATVGTALQAVQLAHPALQGYLLDSAGAVPRHIVVFVENVDIRHGQGVATAVTDNTVITVLLPVAGGAGEPHAVNAAALSTDAVHRYGRQLLLPWMSGDAQRRFRMARVGITIVAGDPASHWACLYLAHAGVGHLQLVGDLACCDGPIDQLDVQGSPLLRAADLGAPRAQQLQRQLTARIPQLIVSITSASAAGADLTAHGNGKVSQAMWHGSHLAATWLRQTATHTED